VRNQLAGQSKVAPSKPGIAWAHLARPAPNRPVSPASNGPLGFSNTGSQNGTISAYWQVPGEATPETLLNPQPKIERLKDHPRAPLEPTQRALYANSWSWSGIYPEVEISCPGADFLLFRGRLHKKNGLLELQDKVVPSKPSITRVLPASC
jgi:hypothetical protein